MEFVSSGERSTDRHWSKQKWPGRVCQQGERLDPHWTEMTWQSLSAVVRGLQTLTDLNRNDLAEFVSSGERHTDPHWSKQKWPGRVCQQWWEAYRPSLILTEMTWQSLSAVVRCLQTLTDLERIDLVEFVGSGERRTDPHWSRENDLVEFVSSGERLADPHWSREEWFSGVCQQWWEAYRPSLI